VTAADATTQNYTVTITVASLGGTWTAKLPFGGTARSDAVGFSIGTNGYIGTGWNGTVYYNDFWQYNSVTGTWTQKQDFGGAARKAAVGFAIGAKGYIGTGIDGLGLTKDFWEYTPAANAGLGSWTVKAEFGGEARSSAVGFGSLCGNGYIGTGSTLCSYFKDFWEYDPASGTLGLGTWTQRNDFGGAERDSAVGFLIGGFGYIGTGWNGAVYYNDFWEYQP